MTSGGKERKQRLDLLLTERGLAESRQKAQALILAGKVRVDGARADKAGTTFPESARIEIIGGAQRFASRAGEKLEGALTDFSVDPSGKICLDVGSSTGGFTDCLLQHGAARVFAVDVTTNQLAWKLQQDSRVTQIELNARYLQPNSLPATPALITADLSFISVAKVVPRLAEVAAPGADILILVKPQFELEREDVGSGGIVRDPLLQERAVAKVRDAAIAAGLDVVGSRPSQVRGAEGNQEYFLHLRRLARHAENA